MLSPTSLFRISVGLALGQCVLLSGARAESNAQGMREALVGVSAYAACKRIHAGYSQTRADRIVATAIEQNNWTAQKNWLRSPQAVQTIKLVSEAMNPECSDFNQDSPQFIPAMKAIDAL
ncbi:MAG: hypothetical protein CL860_05085 [Cyanobium sp. MED195]|nr:hypothetical protein [Cyanobium sp. MED195]